LSSSYTGIAWISDLLEQNPFLTEVGSTCTMVVGLYYCVQINYGASTSSTSATSSSSTTSATTLVTSTTTGNGITTPTPIQTSMVTDCDAFHSVTAGDGCSAIAASAGISLDDFYAWNPAVGDTCLGLDTGYYVCIDIVGYTASTTATTSTAGNGITTPTPIQTSMVTDCDVFHSVTAGDGCSAIAASAGISLDDFYAWNPAVGDTCLGLDTGYYVCIDIVGYTASTTAATTSTAGNGITTPTPIQTSMVTNCDVFHSVTAGDGCSAIAASAGIPLDTFYAWNPAVGDTCSGLDTGYYVCIDIVGYTGATTTAGNGITTPTPTQSGMVTSCDLFTTVTAGAGCSAIAASAGISLTNFYAWNPAVGDTCGTLQAGYYVCIGVE
jgi:LysM repeat protein